MDISDTKLVKDWHKAAKLLSGKFSIAYQKHNGGDLSGGLYLFCIDMRYRRFDLRIETGIPEYPLIVDEFDACSITITATCHSFEDIELSIWRKDYFDKIFKLKSATTGYKDFDNTLGVQCSKSMEKHLSVVFENENLRAELINDNLRAYNVCTNNQIVEVRRRSALKMKGPEMINNDVAKLCLFLDGLIATKVL